MSQQFLRKATLIVSSGDEGLDLSEMRFRFEVVNADVQSPNNCSIRVYNLSEATARQVQKEFTQVTVQAGYQEASYGVVFQGTIKQFRRGKESAVDGYLDILAADGDEAYNHAVVNKTLAAGSNGAQQVVNAHVDAMGQYGISAGSVDTSGLAGGILPRGKVLFGMARIGMERVAPKQWSIQNGKVQVIPLDGYLPTEAVVLNSGTGLIGMPEQTEDGIKARCLLNPKIMIGGLVKIDQKAMNEINANRGGAFIPYNQYTGMQFAADVTNDGLYRVYVAEHRGDTRGQEWYTDLVCLAVDASTSKVTAAN